MSDKLYGFSDKIKLEKHQNKIGSSAVAKNNCLKTDAIADRTAF